MSTLRVNTVRNAAGSGQTDAGQIGVGQTWQDLTATRALATNYTNNTGRPITVQIQTSQAAGGVTRFNLGLGAPVTFVELGSPQVNGQCPYPQIVVPDGWSYSLTNVAGGNSIVKWWELRA